MNSENLRIATLVPAATDIVCALGLGSSIVAVSHECDHPMAEGLAVATSSNVPAAGVGGEASASEVDAAVSAAVAAGQALYGVDTGLLASLEVDLVVSQTICDVCAVRSDHFSHELGPDVAFVDLNATSVEGLYADIEAVAAALGVTDRGEVLNRAVAQRLAAVRGRTRGSTPLRVATIEWTDPLFIGGHWVPEIVELAGGANCLGSAGTPSHRIAASDLLAADPQVVLVLPCGFDLDGAHEEAARMSTTSLVDLPAECQVWALDANRLMSRCTHIVATAVETVAAILSGDEPDGACARRILR
ncbi:MAG: ABC transporter substrate-binding protein [Acidimicrobiales bacterium]